MKKEKIKVYIYTRVSTAMQIDGYSLDAQKSRMKAYAEFNDYEVVGEYEDAGKSGKSIEGRIQFNQMMEDIKSGKDGVSYVLVFKLSRFGRNAADVLSTLQVMQDFGVNLICVEDGIDSSKDAGKLMISVLSAVAEIERENIRVQTMEGRIQKAREGKWNGGFAPYGYKLEKGQLFINEEEAAAIRVIFDQYVHTDTGANGLAKYLATHGIHKIQRQNGKNPLFDAALIRRILKNPVYCGKIAYGRRRTEKVHGTRNDYRLVEQDDYLLVDGLHEGIVSEELWHGAQVKLLAQAEKYEHVNRGKDTKIHLLSGIVKCPVCGGDIVKTMFGYGCANYSKENPDSCRFAIGKIAGVSLKEAQVKELLLRGKTDVIKGFVAKTGMKFDAPLKLTPEGQIAFDFPEKPKPVETTLACPKCGKMLKKSQWYYECECGFKVSHTVAKVALTEEVMRELLETGKTKDKVTGFVSKAGNTFDTCLKLEDDRIVFDFDNPGTTREGASGGKGGERMFYEELEENAQPQPLPEEDGAQYIGEDVPPFYDAMAKEYAAYEEEEAKQQAAASNFLDEFPG